ncbi:MAG TPA: hypothetical protein VMK12_32110 [Anaeromyxobacteraceae bacterium]|nr:hypothetical protein [Anaeromyxobacteraceae bacterium]
MRKTPAQLPEKASPLRLTQEIAIVFDKATGRKAPAALQQLWFATLRSPWSSLAIVPAHPGCRAREIAQALTEVGTAHTGKPVRLVGAEQIELKQSADLIHEIESQVLAGTRVIVALDPVVQNSAGIAIALAADAVLLAVVLERGDLASARRTVDLIGSQRIIGSVVLHPDWAP